MKKCLLLVILLGIVGCTTTRVVRTDFLGYDKHGRPVYEQKVVEEPDPKKTAAAVVAGGLMLFLLSHKDQERHYHRPNHHDSHNNDNGNRCRRNQSARNMPCKH